MMAADYRHIDGLENRRGRHYSRFPPFSPTPALAGQSLAPRKLRDAGSNRRSRVKIGGVETLGEPAIDRGEEIAGFGPPALLAPQSGEAGGSAQFQRFCLLG